MILWLLKLGITMLIHNKDDIQFVTEFPCFLGHPVNNQEKVKITKQTKAVAKMEPRPMRGGVAIIPSPS